MLLQRPQTYVSQHGFMVSGSAETDTGHGSGTFHNRLRFDGLNDEDDDVL